MSVNMINMEVLDRKYATKVFEKPGHFFVVCGELTFTSQRRKFTSLIEQCYLNYFGFPVRNQDKSWVPHKCCVTCVRLLLGWAKQEPRHLSFAIPMIWTEPKDHGISKQSVVQATTNYVCSEQYIEMMVKVSVMNILYHRLPVPDIFYSKEFHAIPYKVVRNEHIDAPIIRLYRKWMNGFKDAFRKRYLEELVLFFYNDETKEIEENFVFKFFYEPNINNKQACTDLTEPTEKLLKALISLGDSPKLDGKTLSLHVEMFYVPDTPIKYKPEYFVEKTMCNTLRYQMESAIFDNPKTFARLCSKFHYFKGTYYRKTTNNQPSIEPESEPLIEATNKKRKNSSQRTSDNKKVESPKMKKTSNRSKPVKPSNFEESDEENYIGKKILELDFDIPEKTCCKAETSLEVNKTNSQLSVEHQSEPLVEYNSNEKKLLSQSSPKTDDSNKSKSKKPRTLSKKVSILEDHDEQIYNEEKIRNTESDIFVTIENEADASSGENDANSQLSVEPLVGSTYKRKRQILQSSPKIDKIKKPKIKKSLNESKAVALCSSEVDYQNNIDMKKRDMETDIFETAPTEAKASLENNDTNSQLSVEHQSESLVEYNSNEKKLLSQSSTKTDDPNKSKSKKPRTLSKKVSILEDHDEQIYNEEKIRNTESDIFVTIENEADASSGENDANSQLSVEPLVGSTYKRKRQILQSSPKIDKIKKPKIKKSLNESKAVALCSSEVDYQNNIDMKKRDMETDIFDTAPTEAKASLENNDELNQNTLNQKLKKFETKNNSNRSAPVTPCVSNDENQPDYIEKTTYEVELDILDIFDTARSEGGTSSGGNPENSQFLEEPELESLITPREKEKHRSQTLAEIDAINSKINSQSDAQNSKNENDRTNIEKNIFDSNIDIFETAPSEVSDPVTVDISDEDYRFPNDEDIDLIVSTVNNPKEIKEE